MEVSCPELLWVVILSGIICAIMAISIGANDVANAFSTSIGSGTLKLRGAIIIAFVFEIMGALILGATVSDSIRTKVLNFKVFNDVPHELALGMLSASIGSSIWLIISTYFGIPVSTTHSIIGALAGFGMASGRIDSVHWPFMSYILLSWFFVPLIAVCISFIFYILLQQLILIKNSSYYIIYHFHWLFIIVTSIPLSILLTFENPIMKLKDPCNTLENYINWFNSSSFNRFIVFIVILFILVIISCTFTYTFSFIRLKNNWCYLKEQLSATNIQKRPSDLIVEGGGRFSAEGGGGKFVSSLDEGCVNRFTEGGSDCFIEGDGKHFTEGEGRYVSSLDDDDVNRFTEGGENFETSVDGGQFVSSLNEDREMYVPSSDENGDTTLNPQNIETSLHEVEGNDFPTAGGENFETSVDGGKIVSSLDEDEDTSLDPRTSLQHTSSNLKTSTSMDHTPLNPQKLNLTTSMDHTSLTLRIPLYEDQDTSGGSYIEEVNKYTNDNKIINNTNYIVKVQDEYIELNKLSHKRTLSKSDDKLNNLNIMLSDTLNQTNPNKTETIFSVMQIISSTMIIISHSANDIANAISPFVTILFIYINGINYNENNTPWYILLIGGICMSIGLATFGYKVIQNVGLNLTKVTPSRGYAINTTSSTLLLALTHMGVPISSTQCIVSSILGVGLVVCYKNNHNRNNNTHKKLIPFTMQNVNFKLYKKYSIAGSLPSSSAVCSLFHTYPPEVQSLSSI